MAVLQEQMSKYVNPFADAVKDDPAPAGTWIATVIDVKDQFGVSRPSYDNPQVMEVVDLTTFLFGYRDQAGQPHRIASKTMRISGNEKSNLFGFLKQALGAAPKYGWDYCEMKGRKVLLTVAHEPRRNGQGTYPSIAALCPVPSGMAGGHAEGGVRKEELGGGGGTVNSRQSAVGSMQAAGAVSGGQMGAPNAQVVTGTVGAAGTAGTAGNAAPLYPVAEAFDEPLPF